jgi:hypothetical protein
MKYFHPTEVEEGYSLSIHYGKGGARLSHDHEKQVNIFIFVLKS